MKNSSPLFWCLLVLGVLIIRPICGNAHAVTIAAFEGFVDNIKAGRFNLSDQAVDFQGELHSDYEVVISGTTVHGPYGRDPQLAMLLSEFSLNGVSVIDALTDYALLPENVMFTEDLGSFMGDSTLTGTSAFVGELHDANGSVIPASDVGFGVLETMTGERYLAPVAFVSDVSCITGNCSFVLDFDPVAPSSVGGTFTGTGRELFAYELLIPEPATLSLLALGGLAMLRRRKR